MLDGRSMATVKEREKRGARIAVSLQTVIRQWSSERVIPFSRSPLL